MSLLLAMPGMLKQAAGAWTPTDLGAKLIFWADPTDLSTQWQNVEGSSQVDATGQTVNRIDDKGGSGRFITSTDIGSGGPNLVISGSDNYWNFAEGEGLRFQTAPPQTTTDALAVNVLSDLASFILFPTGNVSTYVGVGINGNASAWHANAGTPTVRIDGAAPATDDRDGLYDAVATSAWESVVFESVDTSTNGNWDSLTVAFYSGGGGLSYSGAMGDIIITTSLTTGERDSLEAWLASRKP